MTFAQMQMNQQAEDILEHALKLKQLHGYLLANTQLTLANIYMRKNQFEKALEYAHNSLENSVNPIPAMNVVAHALLRLNEIDGSLEVFEQMKTHLNDDSYLLELDFPSDLIEKGIELANKAKKGV
jgi:tetratricopeptide (TPR) repeat protein